MFEPASTQQNQIYQELVPSNKLQKTASVIEKMRLGIAFMLVIVIFAGISTSALSPASSGQALASPSLIPSSADLFYIDQINKLRLSLGEKPLSYMPELEVSASLKARSMITENYWAHYSPSGESFADFIWRQTPGSQRVGENLARCFSSRSLAYEALLNSPTHYKIMTGDFSSMAASELVNTNDGCTYTVLHFAKN